MVRKAIYKHATQVDTATYPDDGSSPVGSNEWNEAPDQAGMIGNTPTTSTITIATGVATITDSVTVVAAETGTTDTLDKLSITNTNEFDLVYLFADTGDTITLTHTSSPSADGHIATVSSVDETLSSTTPTILIRKGNYWYGYGGGVVNAVSDIGDVTITSNSAGEILKWNGSAWVNNTLAEADIGSATAVALNTSKTGITSGQASAITANTAKVTYPSADSTKLAGIEASATADQTGAEIKSAYEAETNAFTDSQFTKLSNIETSATADQTDAEIRTAVEAATDSNVFTDADHSKLNAIEASATADQSNAEIVAAVEAGTDSNTFTDADHSKLNAIEAAADVTDATNVNAAGALMLSDTDTTGLGIVIDEDAMGSNSATKVPTQQSVKAYVDSVSASDISLQGDYNASTNSPDLDTSPSGILKGDHYVVSVAGTFFSESLQAGDSVIASQDNPTTFAHWIVTNNNLTTPISNSEVSASAAIDATKIADGTVTSTEFQYINTLSSNAQTQIDAKSPTAGNTSLVTTGTVSTGTWNATPIAQSYIAAEAINESKLQVSNAPTNGLFLSAQSGNTGGLTWASVPAGYSAPTIGSTSIGSGATVTTLAGLTLTNPALGASYLDITKMSAPSDPGTGLGRVYVKQIDSNNDGIFIKIKKAGAFVEVQIA
jgi:hypothetical protein